METPAVVLFAAWVGLCGCSLVGWFVICPYCSVDNDKVIDSRASDGGKSIRRRRECLGCASVYDVCKCGGDDAVDGGKAGWVA